MHDGGSARAIDGLFDELLQRGGSDLHLGVGSPPMVRIRGELQALRPTAMAEREVTRLLDELLDEERRHRFAQERDLDFALAHGSKARFRANYFVKAGGPAAVFRVIPSRIPGIEDLGIPSAVVGLVDRPSGLVLVSGATGSGKSTTLATLLAHVNQNRLGHILTIEDPVEFVHTPVRCQITHREVGLDCPNFEEAIRSAGREDADVVLVGELRGPETMRLALQLAAAGVLVLATVHTNSAVATIDRFVNSFPAGQQPQVRGLLADALVGIVAQQLLRRADGQGRVAAYEVLVGTPAVSAVIREARTPQLMSLIQAGRREGMQSMDACLEQLVGEGKITARDALERASDKDAFERSPAIASRLTGPRSVP